MIKVETADGIVLYINPKQILMIGSVIADGVPVIGQARVMLLGGIGLLVKADPQELSVFTGTLLA